MPMKHEKMDYGIHDVSKYLDKGYEVGKGYTVGDKHGIYDASKNGDKMDNMKKAMKNSESSVKY